MKNLTPEINIKDITWVWVVKKSASLEMVHMVKVFKFQMLMTVSQTRLTKLPKIISMAMKYIMYFINGFKPGSLFLMRNKTSPPPMTVLKDEVPQAHGGSRSVPLDSIVSNETLLSHNPYELSKKMNGERRREISLSMRFCSQH